MRRTRSVSGFTLIELMLGLVVLAVLLALAIPSFSGLTEKYRLKGASERLASDLQFARSEAVARNVPVRVEVTGGTNWCIGVSDSGGCDCSNNSCQVDGNIHAVVSDEYEDVGMVTGDQTVLFSGIRGLPDGSTTFSFSNDSGLEVDVNLSALGSVRICSPSGHAHVSGYNECPAE